VGNPLADVRAFFELGGGVLYLILGVTFFMWTLILERQWYYRRVAPAEVREAIETWESRSDQSSWYAHQIRLQLISRVRQNLEGSLLMVKALVALCPLLGLLGTVTGMIEVFDVMAISGSGNVRAMAAGVSKATIPTMAGMVAALSGLYFSVSMSQLARRETERVASHLTHV
jgi:biopolymer transport protein ExbB